MYHNDGKMTTLWMWQDIDHNFNIDTLNSYVWRRTSLPLNSASFTLGVLVSAAGLIHCQEGPVDSYLSDFSATPVAFRAH